MQLTNEELLSSMIEGKELVSITFLREYVQLNFDGPYLNVYRMPEIGAGESILRPDDLGYYDMFHKLIGKEVFSAKEFSDTCLLLNLKGEYSIRVSLKAEDHVCVEAAMLQDGKGKQWTVW